MSEPLCCPWCGEPAQVKKPEFGNEWKIMCGQDPDDCPVVCYVEHEDREKAIEMWNERQDRTISKRAVARAICRLAGEVVKS